MRDYFTILCLCASLMFGCYKLGGKNAMQKLQYGSNQKVKGK